MGDDELKDLGLSSGAIMQLRSIMTKMSSTNGLCGVDKREPAPNTGRRKLDAGVEMEQVTTGREVHVTYAKLDKVNCIPKDIVWRLVTVYQV